MTVNRRLINTSLNEVVPTKDLFGPHLEDGKQVKVRSICQRKFVLAVEDETLDCLIVVIDVRVGDQRIDTVHLHRDFPVYWDLATKYRLTKLAVVLGSRLVR